MTRAARIGRGLLLVFGIAAAVIGLTWVLEQAIPPPFSGYLAAITVALVGIEVYKRRPGPRATRMFRIYLRARGRNAVESDARLRLVSRLTRDEASRQRLVAELATVWVGASEKARAIEGVRFLLTREGRRLDAQALAAAYDRVRDQVSVPGWEALPQEFLDAVHDRLDERERAQLEGLVARYRLLEQKFFRSPSALGADPAAGLMDFARLLHSMGNRLAKQEPGDAERAYRLSLRLRPARNLAHAGLAILLEQMGRAREAAQEAQTALGVLDEYSQQTATDSPSTEDITPFRSPTSLREALQRVVAAS